MIKKDQDSGMVSIMIAMMLTIIISLIILGFARVSTRSKIASIDSQLLLQAEYAAEVGISDAIEFLNSPVTPEAKKTKNDCDVATDFGNGSIAGRDDVRYTCLKINPNPNDIVFDDFDSISQKSTLVRSLDQGAIKDMVIGWEDSTGKQNYIGCSESLAFDTRANWNSAGKPGILRLDIYPVPEIGEIVRDDIIKSSASMYVMPTSCTSTDPATTIDYQTIWNQKDGLLEYKPGTIVKSSCSIVNVQRKCLFRLNNLPENSQFYVQIRSIYSDASITISPKSVTNGDLKTKDSQVVIESTGVSNNSVKSLRVRYSPSQTSRFNDQSLGALQIGSEICKNFYFVGPNPVDLRQDDSVCTYDPVN
jgi:hypothetical protein